MEPLIIISLRKSLITILQVLPVLLVLLLTSNCATPPPEEIAQRISSSTQSSSIRDFTEILKFLNRNPGAPQKRVSYILALEKLNQQFEIRAQDPELYQEWILAMKKQSRSGSSHIQSNQAALRVMASLDDLTLLDFIEEQCGRGDTSLLAAALTGWLKSVKFTQENPALRQKILEITGDALNRGSAPALAPLSGPREQNPEFLALSLEHQWYQKPDQLVSDWDRFSQNQLTDSGQLRLLYWVERWIEARVDEINRTSNLTDSLVQEPDSIYQDLFIRIRQVAGEVARFPMSSRQAQTLLANRGPFELLPVYLDKVESLEDVSNPDFVVLGSLKVELGGLSLITQSIYSSSKIRPEPGNAGWLQWNRQWVFVSQEQWDAFPKRLQRVPQAMTSELLNTSVADMESILLLVEKLDRNYTARLYMNLSPASSNEASRMTDERAIALVRAAGRWIRTAADPGSVEFSGVVESIADYLWSPDPKVWDWVGRHILKTFPESLALAVEKRLDFSLSQSAPSNLTELLDFYWRCCRERTSVSVEKVHPGNNQQWLTRSGYRYRPDLILKCFTQADEEARSACAGFLKYRQPDELANALIANPNPFNLNLLEDLTRVVELKPDIRAAAYRILAQQLGTDILEDNALWITKSLLESGHSEARAALVQFLAQKEPYHASVSELIKISNLNLP